MKKQNRISLVVAALWLCFGFASALVAQPSTSSNRFLFIIDTSAAMKPMEAPLRETVFDLIYSGARGRMTNGDTYGVWFVNDQNDTSFQMETWKQKHIVELGAHAVSALREHGLKGRTRLDVALADATRVVKNIGDLTVVLVSNGDSPIAGTPFDNEINARFHDLSPEMKRAKATLNTALIAQDGQFVAWAMNSPDFLLEVPVVSPKPKSLEVEIAVANTNSSAVTPNTIAAVPAPKRSIPKPPAAMPRVAASPIIITKESVAAEKRTYAPSTPSAIEPAPIVTPTNAHAPVLVAATNSAPVAPSNTAIVTAPATTVSPTSPVVVAVAPTPKIEPASVIAATAAPHEIQSVVPANTESKPASSVWLWLVTGASVALACVFGLMLLWRGRRAEPSLISQSLVRERVHVS